MELDGESSATLLSEAAMEATECFKATPITAKRVHVSKEDVFKQTLKTLSLEMHESRACTVGNNQVLGSVYIDVPAHGQHPLLHRRKFFGDYKLTKEDALESAKLAALVYLQKAGLIFVEDVNQSELIKSEARLAECHHKLLAASSWAAAFQERAESLEAQLIAVRTESKKLVDAAMAHGVETESSSPHAFALKTDATAVQSFDAAQDISTPPPFKEQSDPTQCVLRCKKIRGIGPTSIKKTLFKTRSAGDCNLQGIKLEKKT